MIVTNIVLGCAFIAIGAAMAANARTTDGDAADRSRLTARLFMVAGALFFVAAAIRAVTD
jgi:hypothetical protein